MMLKSPAGHPAGFTVFSKFEVYSLRRLGRYGFRKNNFLLVRITENA